MPLKKCYLWSWDVELGGNVFSVSKRMGTSHAVSSPVVFVLPTFLSIDPNGGDLVRLSTALSPVLGWFCSRFLYFFFLFN